MEVGNEAGIVSLAFCAGGCCCGYKVRPVVRVAAISLIPICSSLKLSQLGCNCWSEVSSGAVVLLSMSMAIATCQAGEGGATLYEIYSPG